MDKNQRKYINEESLILRLIPPITISRYILPLPSMVIFVKKCGEVYEKQGIKRFSIPLHGFCNQNETSSIFFEKDRIEQIIIIERSIKLRTVKKIYFLFFTITFFTQTIKAQRGWEAGGMIGVSQYFGDLNTNFSVKRPGIAVSGVARYNFNERICAKLSATFGQISADDKYSTNKVEQTRNLNFKSNVVDGGAQLEFNFLPYNYFDRNQRFSPYLFLGFNVYNFNPKAKYQDTWYNLRPLGTEGQFKGDEYYTTQMGIMYGGGFKIAFNEEWSMNIEISARKIFTDYLDDVSTTYPNMNDLRKAHGPVAVALSDPSIPDAEGKKAGQVGRQRGNSKTIMINMPF